MQQMDRMIWQKALWISTPQPDPNAGLCMQSAWFRLVFDLQTESSAKLYLTANDCYRLHVNGVFVARGPLKGSKSKLWYDEWNLTSFLTVGQNEILVQVLSHTMQGFRKSNRSGPASQHTRFPGCWLLAAGGLFDTPIGKISDWSTGLAPWTSAIDASTDWEDLQFMGYTATGPFERVDGNHRVGGGSPPLFSAPSIGLPALYASFGGYTPAFPEKRILPNLDTSLLSVHDQITGRSLLGKAFQFVGDMAAIPAGETRTAVFDAGFYVTGHPLIQMKTGFGTRIDIAYAEGASQLSTTGVLQKGLRDDFNTFSFHGYNDTYVSYEGMQTYEPFSLRAFRYLRITVHASGRDAFLYWPTIRICKYPIASETTIASDSSWIKPLWEISKRTLRACMHDTYEDAPYYEQLQYTLDAYLQSLYMHALSGDARLTAKALLDLHDERLPCGLLPSRAPTADPHLIPNFSLHFILMLEAYFMQTADLSMLHLLLPTVEGILGWYDRQFGKAGLVGKSDFWDFVDWVNDWKNANGIQNGEPTGLDQLDTRTGKSLPSATLSMMRIKALDTAASLYRYIALYDRAQQLNEQATQLRAEAHRTFFDAEDSLYWEVPGVCKSQHAQVWAILSSTANLEIGRAIIQKALIQTAIADNTNLDPSITNKTLAVCSFSARFFLFRALQLCELYGETLPLWQPWKDALKDHLTTWPEDFDRQRSDCHGWSALPLYEITHHLLGVNADAPGWKMVRIQPFVGIVSCMQGIVKTPVGAIAVSWRIDGLQFRIRVQVPPGIPFRVLLPDNREITCPEGGEFLENNEAEPLQWTNC